MPLRALMSVGILLHVATPLVAGQPLAPTERSMGGGDCRDNVYNCADTPNPLPGPHTVWLEEMTWMDVRDALAGGTTTAIVPTGGIEPNGPWLALGKHNYILRGTCAAIAHELGNAICTPVIKLVPEGAIEPASGHMRSPGTLSVRDATFEAVLTDVANSLKMHGFQNIVFIGDSAGNQPGQHAVATRLTIAWKGVPVVAHIPEYYDYARVAGHMANHGLVSGTRDGLHDDPVMTLGMFVVDPYSIRYDERVSAGLATIDGVSLVDRVTSLEHARRIVRFRAADTSRAIQAAIARGGTLRAAEPAPPARTSDATERPTPDPRSRGGGDCSVNVYNCVDTVNPLPKADTVWLEEMTWMDVRDALADGTTTAIVPTGGIEPNGPWLATGKHNYVLRTNCESIARALGDAICSPIVTLVPEGNIDPPSGHMRSPGTLSLQQDTFESLLTDVAHSLKVHGFRTILLIGDSGGNRRGMENVATSLTAAWAGEANVLHIPEYYRAPPGTPHVVTNLGLTSGDDRTDGLHDNPTITLNMMLSDLDSVRWSARVASRQAVIDGVSIANLAQSLAWAQQIVAARTASTVDAIRARMSR